MTRGHGKSYDQGTWEVLWTGDVGRAIDRGRGKGHGQRPDSILR